MERSPGEGNSYTLQNSGLENSMDRAWQATVHGVTESDTMTFTFTKCGTILYILNSMRCSSTNDLSSISDRIKHVLICELHFSCCKLKFKSNNVCKCQKYYACLTKSLCMIEIWKCI